jgi:hypothetical protein
MGSKLYVGGLPYSATESQLTTLFAEHGTVESARVVADKFTGRSRGFGFVEMVNEAKPMEPRFGGGAGGGGRSGGGNSRNRY